MLFDTWGGALAHDAYQAFSLAYARGAAWSLTRERRRQNHAPHFFTKGGGLWLESMAIGCRRVGPRLDRFHRGTPAPREPPRGTVRQSGPTILFADVPAIERAAEKIITDFPLDGGRGHVFNLGHGISQFTSPDRESTSFAVHRASA